MSIKLLTNVLLTIGLSSALTSSAQDTLWISYGTWVQELDTMDALRFNPNDAFSSNNAVIDRPADSASQLVLVNNDSLDHTLSLSGSANDAASSWIGANLPAGDTTALDFPALSQGSYRYFLNGDRAHVLGAAGLLRVGFPAPGQPGNPGEPSDPATTLLFNWNLCEWSPTRIATVTGPTPEQWTPPYIPKYFTINERSYPATIEDPATEVNLLLGQTGIISVTNHGYMDQVVHFHGFHVTILYDTATPQRQNWSKDTVPVRAGHTVTLELNADQLGTYPVHAHNLIAVTNAGFYPGGMLTLIQVTP